MNKSALNCLLLVLIVALSVFYLSCSANNKSTSDDVMSKFDNSQENLALLAYFDEFIAQNPDSAIAYGGRASLKESMGDLQGALEDYNKVILLDSSEPEAYSARGLLKSKMGDIQGALDDYSQAIVLNPAYAQAYYRRGNLYSDLNRWEEAL